MATSTVAPMSVEQTILLISKVLSEIVWGWPALLLILGAGFYLGMRLHWLPFIRCRYIFRSTLGSIFPRHCRRKGTVSPFHAFCTSMGATIGIGNVTGVAGAITLGGPGAVFWMWISALLGMCVKFAEVTLAVRFRERNPKGDWVGGPMYYIKNGLGKEWDWLAILFSVLAVLSSFSLGNIIQTNSIASSVSGTLCLLWPALNRRTLTVVIGLVVAALVAAVLLGGIRRIGEVCALLVPVMGLGYIFMGLLVIVSNYARLPGVFDAIFAGAFCPQAVTGGAVGMTIQQTVRLGLGRGIFSNEAGLGSGSIGHAAADVHDPVKQGFYGVVEVFVDTLILCTVTAMLILCGVGVTDIAYGTVVGAQLPTAGLATVIPQPYASLLMSLCLTFFAFSTVLSWGLYGSRCVEFLLGQRATKGYLAVFVVMAAVGAVISLEMAWDMADVLNGLLLVPNMIAILLLTPEVVRLTRLHFLKEKTRALPKK